MKVNQERWKKAIPRKGNHIRVNRKFYYHHGIYISDREVIHFTGEDADNILDFESNEVIKTNLAKFLKGGKVETKIYSNDELDDLYPTNHIIKYARACLGDKGYNLVFNNCEHFANICTLNRYRSKQVEEVFKTIIGGVNMNILNNGLSLLKTAGNGIKNILTSVSSSSDSSSEGNRSVSNINRDPDKVKIAEVERKKELDLREKEIEKINAKKEAKLEIIKANEDMQWAIEEAKAKGMLLTAQAISKLQSNLNQLAEDSFKIIEHSSLEIVKEIERFYNDLEQKIKKDDIDYYKNKLPKLHEQLEKIGDDSPLYDVFIKGIDEDMSSHIKRHNELILKVDERREKLIESHIKSKDKMIESTTRITEKLTSKYSVNNYLVHNNSNDKNEDDLNYNKSIKAIDVEDKEMISE